MPKKKDFVNYQVKVIKIHASEESIQNEPIHGTRKIFQKSFGILLTAVLSASFLWLFIQEITKERKKNVLLFQLQPISPPHSFKASTWFSDYEAMKKVIHLYDNIHPFIYTLEGGLSNTGELLCIWTKKQRQDRVEELRRLNPRVQIIPTIFRWENPHEKINEAIGMKGRQDILRKHILAIIREIETYGYDGIDIDYEGMTCDKKENFEKFIVLLSQELKKRGKILSIAVHPKTPLVGKKPYFLSCPGLQNKIHIDFKELWRGPLTHDYAFLARYADKIKVMAYELHPRKYENPGPGPQAPQYWLEQIIRYAKAKVPAHKLYMAIPTYGYDWSLNCRSPARSVYWSDVERLRRLGARDEQPTNISLILSHGEGRGSWHNLTKFRHIHEGKIYEDGSLWYREGECDRVAFYMNRRAFESKMDLLRRHRLAGFSFWQLLSDNDPQINDYLALLIQGQLPPILKVSPLEGTLASDNTTLGYLPHMAKPSLGKDGKDSSSHNESYSGITVLEEES